MVAGLLWVLAALMGLVLLVLSLPVRLVARIENEPRLLVSVKASVLGGLLPAFPVFHSDTKKTKDTTPATPAKKDKKRDKQDDGRKPKRTLAWAKAIPNLARKLVREIAIERLWARIVVGLGDPADTGVLFGQMASLRYALAGWPILTIDVQPDFTQARLGAEAELALRFTPIRLVPPLVSFGRDLVRA